MTENLRKNLPRVIATAGEAKDIAAELFPTFRLAQRMDYADQDRYPKHDYHPALFGVRRRAFDAWAALLDWALEPSSRLYKRARPIFMAEAARRFEELIDEAMRDANRHYSRITYYERARKHTEQREAAARHNMDGGGI